MIIRIVMIEKLEKENIQTLHLPSDKINWYKKNLELIIDGKMFDVKTIQKQGDEYFITGLFDEMETTLNNQLAMTHEQGNQHTNNSNQLFQVCLGLIAIQPAHGDTCINEDLLISSPGIIDFTTPLLTKHRVVFSPPPESGTQI
jgi:hypothetical protein